MAEVFSILGQSKPGAAANATLYTVPDKTRTVVSSLTICETGGATATVRVYVVPYQGSASTSNALYYGLSIPANDTFIATVGLTLGPGDIIVVYASTANICFQCFGSELSVT